MKFSKGDEVVWLHDGQEIPAIVMVCGTRYDQTEFYHIEIEGQKKVVDDLAPAKRSP